MALYQDLKKEFLNPATKLAFDCIDANTTPLSQGSSRRQQFIKELENRQLNPGIIGQAGTPLCGPAAFVYCFAREWPDDYGCYVLELALRGIGKLGSMEVNPGDACRKNTVLIGKNGLTIAPPDWLALASLRKLAGTRSNAAGITFPGTLEQWFKSTGKFSRVQNRFILEHPDTSSGTYDETSLVITKSPGSQTKALLKNLLSINSLPASYVCMLIHDDVLTGSIGGTIPNHWVVLGDGTGKGGGKNGNCGTEIRTVSTWSLVQRPSARVTMACPVTETPGEAEVSTNGDAILKRYLDFLVYTWGNDSKYDRITNAPRFRPIDLHFPNGLTVEKFLNDYYFGYVAATV
jgi:hypothetical protein